MPIHSKLHAVMKETGYVQKSSRNKEQNYSFASEGAFIEHVRPAMLEAGVVCYPVGIDQQIGLTPKGTQVLVQGTATFRFQDTEDGSFVDILVPYSGADSTDKAQYKAMTGARKYALRQALLIETGDDTEKDERPSLAEAVDKSAAKVKADAAEARAPYDAWLTHGKVLVKDITPADSAAYAEQLNLLGITNAEACKLLGVKSMKEGRPDKTLSEVVTEVAGALALVNAAKKQLDEKAQ